MFVRMVPRGHYYYENKEIVCFSDTADEICRGRKCRTCGRDADSILLLYERDEKKVFMFPTCGCELRKPTPSDFDDWCRNLGLEGLPFFNVEEGPVFRIDAEPKEIKDRLGGIRGITIDGQIVDAGPHGLVFTWDRSTFCIFPDGMFFATVVDKNRMDTELLGGKLLLHDFDELMTAIRSRTDISHDWARELVYRRVMATIFSAEKIASFDIPIPDSCSCEECKGGDKPN